MSKQLTPWLVYDVFCNLTVKLTPKLRLGLIGCVDFFSNISLSAVNLSTTARSWNKPLCLANCLFLMIMYTPFNHYN